MLVHTALDRAAQVARYWAERDCPVAIHVDRRVKPEDALGFRDVLSDLPCVRFTNRRRCRWGTWSLVAASQDAARLLLEDFPAINHVFLASGSCLPLRPVAELKAYLSEHAETDFIESVTVDDVPWTQGGLDTERFTLSFPFSWKDQRTAFDRFVEIQRKIGYQRRIPEGIEPHLGSQWWCLTRRTLTEILMSSRRTELERYFRRVWIPDESYFQTVSRLHSANLESRSLTLSKFDFQGKPHLLFDDHLQLLRRSDCFVARKVWPEASKLYETFLSDDVMIESRREPRPGRVDRVFTKAVQRRIHGRSGLLMPGRFPSPHFSSDKTAGPYVVLSGLDCVFPNLDLWIEGMVECTVHGRIFARDKVHFSGASQTFSGALSDSATLRDYDSNAFLRNMIWNTRGERQCFFFSPKDQQTIVPFLCGDANARVTLVTGAWAVELFLEEPDPKVARKMAALLQRTEGEFVGRMRHPSTRAQVRILTLAELLEQPMEVLQAVVDDIGNPSSGHLTEVPKMVELAGFDTFLDGLRNLGMNPYLAGDFASALDTSGTRRGPSKPYLVR